MTALRTEPRLTRPDDLYERLIAMHAGLGDADSHKLNASLILVLANHIGDEAVFDQAMAIARATIV